MSDKMRILLVEDEPGYARFLREVLLDEATRDHELDWTQSLEEASSRIRQSQFDIILLDLGLPDADGIEALTTISSLAPSTPIVVLSSLGDLDVAIESMRVGAQEYLVKGQSEHLLLPRAMHHAIERKRLQDAAATARAEAERANAAKDEFLAMLGHELRNPLAPIVTGLTLMRRHGFAPIEHELTIVQRQVENVVRLVDDLLDVARIARGKLDLNRVDLDLADAIAGGVETAAPLLEQQRHTLHLDVARGIFFVHGDRVRLAQVVANLLTNAAKYTDPGGNIWVSARDDDGFVELRTRDDGSGMSPDLLARVFGWFEQGAQSIDRKSGGLGLGLAIVQNIVTLHGGTVAATSEGEGKGSEIVVRLPIKADAVMQPVVADTRTLQTRAGEPRRVLIVDDNQDNAEMLELGLKQLGHIILRTHDGASALEVARGFEPDVALLDIGLPMMDGYELAQRLRALLTERMPVLVAVTGYGHDSDRARARAAGFDHHLVKPTSLLDLAKLIDSLPR